MLKYFFIGLVIILFPFIANASEGEKNVNEEKSHPRDVFVIQTDGGLGNRMFLLAGQAAYARRFNKDICLRHSFDPVFNVPYRICTKDEIQKAMQSPCSFLRFSSMVLKASECLIFRRDGYLQDERFFQDQKDFIKKIFQFSEILPKRLDSLVAEMKNKNSVAIHIRRGDYLKSYETYPIMSLEYYEHGADYIQSKTRDPIHLYVFSDDIKWVKENFKSKYPFTIIEGNSASIDMQLMTLCHHNIIANSTFSWWGAYLNKNPDKIIIAPDQWNKVDRWWGEDIILKDWIVLPSGAQK